jgi:hypothetical protein
MKPALTLRLEDDGPAHLARPVALAIAARPDERRTFCGLPVEGPVLLAPGRRTTCAACWAAATGELARDGVVSGAIHRSLLMGWAVGMLCGLVLGAVACWAI